MNRFLYIVAMMFVWTTASAQWDEYVPPCEHKGSQDLWQVVGFREGLASWEKSTPDRGTVRWSDSCVEIDCENIVMYFDVRKYEKVGPNYFKVYREQYDELYDYMEVRQGFGQHREKYMIIMGRLDEDGNIQNTAMVICKPMKRNGVQYFRPAVGGMR